MTGSAGESRARRRPTADIVNDAAGRPDGTVERWN